jgi:hypothetical protein
MCRVIVPVNVTTAGSSTHVLSAANTGPDVASTAMIHTNKQEGTVSLRILDSIKV